jgi:hypothetical protein
MATQTNRSMVSETSICNQALSWLGQGRIESLQEPSRSAEFCADNYPFIRDSVLEDGYWSFAVGRVVSTVADQPAWDSELYLHPIPLDWVSVEKVVDTSKCEISWEVEGRDVLAPLTTVWMRGTRRITDTGKFSPLFVQAVAARLAVDLAIPIAGSSKLQADMWSPV